MASSRLKSYLAEKNRLVKLLRDTAKNLEDNNTPYDDIAVLDGFIPEAVYSYGNLRSIGHKSVRSYMKQKEVN